MTAEVAAPPAQVYQVFIQASPEKVWQAITSEEFHRPVLLRHPRAPS